MVLFRILGSGLAYFCMATVLAQAAMLGYLWSNGWLNREKLVQMTWVARGEMPSLTGHGAGKSDEPSPSTTLADIDSARSLRLRQLELREQAAQNVLQQVRFETEMLTYAKDRFDRVYETFKKQLGQDKVSAITRGNENARLLLESIKPDQSKDLIMEMLRADELDVVVTLFESMPIAKQAKIAAQFQTGEETKKLNEILRRIRRGLPDTDVIDQTQKDLEQSVPQQ